MISWVWPVPPSTSLPFHRLRPCGRGRLQEGLRHIAVPQLVTPAVRAGIGEDGNVPVNATEADEQRLRCPQQTNLRGTLGIRVFACPVAIIADRGRLLPGRARRETLVVG